MNEEARKYPFISLRDFQNDVRQWSMKNFGEQSYVNPLLGVAEEVGELNHAVLKIRQGIREDKDFLKEQIEDAIGDILIYLADFCSRFDEGVDMQNAVENAWKIVKQRDWKKNPKDGSQ